MSVKTGPPRSSDDERNLDFPGTLTMSVIRTLQGVQTMSVNPDPRSSDDERNPDYDHHLGGVGDFWDDRHPRLHGLPPRPSVASFACLKLWS
jgi:hypothetical protein